MPRKLNIPLPSKGLVVDRPAEYVDERSASETQNMEFNRATIRKRIGTAALGSSLGERIMRFFELQVGPLTRLFRVGPTEVEVLNKATSVWSSVTSTPLTGSADDPISFAFPLLAGAKIVVYTNFIDPIRKCSITGNDAALGGSPPLAKFTQAFGPYLVIAHVTDSGDTFYSRVQWSDAGDPEVWTPADDNNAGSVDLLEDPEDITGLGVFSNFLTVHKANSIYVGQLVTTEDVFRFDRRATGVGAVTGAVIANIPSGEQIFLASDGIHLFNGLTAPLIDSPVQDELREGMNPAYLHRSQAVFVEELDEVWFAIPMGSQTDPETVYKYNWRTKQIYKDMRDDLTALSVYLNTADLTWDDMTKAWDSATERWDSVLLSSLNPVVIFGDNSGDTTKRTAAATSDAGTAIDASWDTKDFTCTDLGEADIDKIVRWTGLEIWAKGGSLDVQYSTDGGESWSTATTLTLSSDYSDDTNPLNVYFDVLSSRIRFRFGNLSLTTSFTLKKYQIEGNMREGRK